MKEYILDGKRYYDVDEWFNALVNKLNIPVGIFNEQSKARVIKAYEDGQKRIDAVENEEIDEFQRLLDESMNAPLGTQEEYLEKCKAVDDGQYPRAKWKIRNQRGKLLTEYVGNEVEVRKFFGKLFDHMEKDKMTNTFRVW